MNKVILYLMTFGLMLSLINCKSNKFKDSELWSINKFALPEKFKGKIKSLIETEFVAFDSFGNYKKGSCVKKIIYSFNEQGRIVEERHYENSYLLEKKISYRYSKNGQLAVGDVIMGVGRDAVKFKINYKCNKNGLIVSEIWEEDNVRYRNTYLYDDKSVLNSLVHYVNEEQYNSFKFNKQGQTIELDYIGQTIEFRYVLLDNGTTIKLSLYNEKPSSYFEREINWL